jgi:chromosome segregation ATPase
MNEDLRRAIENYNKAKKELDDHHQAVQSANIVLQRLNEKTSALKGKVDVCEKQLLEVSLKTETNLEAWKRTKSI